MAYVLNICQNDKYLINFIKRTLLILMILFSLASLNIHAGFMDRLEEQNEAMKGSLESRFEEREEKSKEEDNIANIIERSRNNESSITLNFSNWEETKDSFFEISFYLFLSARRFAIPFFLIMIAFKIILMGFTTGRNIPKRKKFFMGIISSATLLIIVLNIPFMIMFATEVSKDSIGEIGSISTYLFDFLFLLRSESWILATILLIYGLIYRFLSKVDTSKVRVSKYLINISIVMFIVLQVLPLLLDILI